MGYTDIDLSSDAYRQLVDEIKELRERMEFYEAIPDAAPELKSKEEMIEDTLKVLEKFETTSLPKVLALLVLCLREDLLASINQVSASETFLSNLDVLKTGWSDVSVPQNVVDSVKGLVGKLDTLANP